MLIFAVCWLEQVEHLYRCEGRDLELRLECLTVIERSHSRFQWSSDAKTPESISPKWKYEANISLGYPALPWGFSSPPKTLTPVGNSPSNLLKIQARNHAGGTAQSDEGDDEEVGGSMDFLWSLENWPWPLHVSRKYLPKKDGICLCFFCELKLTMCWLMVSVLYIYIDVPELIPPNPCHTLPRPSLPMWWGCSTSKVGLPYTVARRKPSCQRCRCFWH